MSNETKYEYKIISGSQANKFTDLNQELNSLAEQGWEPYQSCAASSGFAMLGTGGFGTGVVIILRRPKS